MSLTHWSSDELLQLLKAHLDYKERTKLLTNSDATTENAVVVNPRLVSSQMVLCWAYSAHTV